MNELNCLEIKAWSELNASMKVRLSIPRGMMWYRSKYGLGFRLVNNGEVWKLIGRDPSYTTNYPNSNSFWGSTSHTFGTRVSATGISTNHNSASISNDIYRSSENVIDYGEGFPYNPDDIIECYRDLMIDIEGEREAPPADYLYDFTLADDGLMTFSMSGKFKDFDFKFVAHGLTEREVVLKLGQEVHQFLYDYGRASIVQLEGVERIEIYEGKKLIYFNNLTDTENAVRTQKYFNKNFSNVELPSCLYVYGLGDFLEGEFYLVYDKTKVKTTGYGIFSSTGIGITNPGLIYRSSDSSATSISYPATIGTGTGATSISYPATIGTGTSANSISIGKLEDLNVGNDCLTDITLDFSKAIMNTNFVKGRSSGISSLVKYK